MKRNLLLLLALTLTYLNASGQDDATYLKANALRFDNAEQLNDNVYSLLAPFQIVMVGEMHGTNESAQFVSGLTKLFTYKGDSVLVGLEIPTTFMSKFVSLHTDSSVYQSEFFSTPPYLDGRESLPWANLIATLNNNPKVKVFFFDTDRTKEVISFRDSFMAMNIKTQFNQHASWRMITLCGNYHNKISNPNAMTSILKRNIAAKICSLNMEYKEGTCSANFSGVFQQKTLGSYPSVFNTTEGYDKYLLLYQAKSNYDYDGIYYTKYITAAKMVSSK